jgi:hypothetical protein
MSKSVVDKRFGHSGGATTGLIWLRIGAGGRLGLCECSNEPSGSIKCREFLD